jgi:hypothetical protein
MRPSTSQGCCTDAKGEINEWIAKDKGFEGDGLSGNLNNLVGMEQWTATAADCLDIKDMGNIATIEVDDLEFEDACCTWKALIWIILTSIRMAKNTIFAIFHSLDFGGLVEEFEIWNLMRADKVMKLLL